MRRDVRSRGGQFAAKTDDDVEGGNTSIPLPTKDGKRPKRRGSRKQSPIAGFLGKVGRAKLRRYLRLIQRNPRQTWKLTVGMLVIALVACLVLTVLIYFEVERDQFSEKGDSKAAALSRPSEIIFNNIPTTIDDEFWLPIEGIEEKEEEWDYGGLSIDFFEEDTGARQLYHDYSLENASYRLPDASRDDDLDG